MTDASHRARRRPLAAADRRILNVVRREGRITNAALAERVGLAASPCLRRLKALEEDGLITGYRAELDRKALGYEVEAFAFVKLEQSEPGWRTRLIEALNRYPEVVACYAITGETDLVLRIVTSDIETYGEFTMNALLTLPGVADVRSSFVLSEIKPDRGVPVPE
ncbi:Lrp/AsnC family transcriptional regulator [Chelatococcus sp. SYSU_G07232]|uniref:Lrp/AsnC family transcriptional regulator n=1 Tax=Chelatococcus albus TaxID=3047466 RepID=A0ABT7AHT3_9HYPH|nr:Lrp/AsnC family transcriptional regulator [Chelatococcus sp. SYSU_G07232]MDJ1158542.1 Lrp/AsnC family transcriptional regulator [Chelatococcus sp. SYSU_G07232]